MKKTLIQFLLLLPSLVCAQSINYSIKGKIENLKAPATIYAYNQLDNKIDSAKITDGTFHFSGTLKKPQPMVLTIRFTEPQVTFKNSLYVSDRETSVVLSDPNAPYNFRVSGSPETVDFNEKLESLMVKALYAIDVTDMKLQQARQAGLADTTRLLNERKLAVAANFEIPRAFIKSHLNSALSLIALDKMGIGEKANPNRVRDLKNLFASLSEQVRGSEDGKQYLVFLNSLK